MNTFSLQNISARIRYGEQIQPARDWFVLVTLGLLVFAALMVWNVWTFDRVVSGESLFAASSKTTSVVNQASLDSVHQVFSSRATEEARYANGLYTFTDPSK